MCCVQTVDTSSKQTCGATLQPGLGLKIDQPFSNRANCTPAAPQLKPFKGGVNDIRAILIRRQLPTLHNFLNETERLPLLLLLLMMMHLAAPNFVVLRPGWLLPHRHFTQNSFRACALLHWSNIIVFFKKFVVIDFVIFLHNSPSTCVLLLLRVTNKG